MDMAKRIPLSSIVLLGASNIFCLAALICFSELGNRCTTHDCGSWGVTWAMMASLTTGNLLQAFAFSQIKSWRVS